MAPSKKPAKPAPKASKTKEREVLVVASKVKDFIKDKGFMTAGETIEALSNKVYELIEAGLARTEANKRSTVKPQDL